MEIPREIKMLPSGWLCSFLQRCQNNIELFKVDPTRWEYFYEHDDNLVSVWYEVDDTMCFRYETMFPLNWNATHKIPFNILLNFLKDVFPCAERECSQVRLYDSKYCEHHRKYYSELYGLSLSPEISSKLLSDVLISGKMDEKKTK